MTGALSTLLVGVLDYAGLFPPAGLDMRNAVVEYEHHLSTDAVGMLAGFVCPAARLDELARNAGGRTWKLSILGTSAESPAEALDYLANDVARIDSFLGTNRGFRISALELRVPAMLFGNAKDLDDFLGNVDEVLSRSRHVPEKVFYELGWAAHWESVLGILNRGNMFRGAKIRTGGLEASAFPSPEQLAAFMIAAEEAGRPWKATAGLHHPVRRFQGEVGTKMHGFLNVFLSAALAFKGSYEAELIALLNEEDAEAFRFNDEAVLWRDHVLDRGLLARMRSDFALSFGSCSYREPIEDLKELELL